MKKKTSWVKILAVLTAVIGAAVAVAGYLKKKSKKLSDELDFDNSMYFDDDDSTYHEDDQDIEELGAIDGVDDDLDDVPEESMEEETDKI
jgi:hypothetical protein